LEIKKKKEKPEQEVYEILKKNFLFSMRNF